MGATVARKNKKQAAWEKEAAKRKRKAALAVRTKKFTDIPEGVSPEDAGVIISRAVTSTEVRIINEYFHKYLTNVGPRATAVPKKTERKLLKRCRLLHCERSKRIDHWGSKLNSERRVDFKRGT